MVAHLLCHADEARDINRVRNIRVVLRHTLQQLSSGFEGVLHALRHLRPELYQFNAFSYAKPHKSREFEDKMQKMSTHRAARLPDRLPDRVSGHVERHLLEVC